MVLKTNFLRGEENAQDGLNDNFEQISEALNIGAGYGQQIGDVHISISPTNPAERFGGTWEQVAQGRALFGASTSDADFATAGKTGGSKTHTHDSGNIATLMQLSGSTLSVKGGTTSPEWQSTVKLSNASATTDVTARTASVQTQGDTGSASSLPPYYVLYVWLRTA